MINSTVVDRTKLTVPATVDVRPLILAAQCITGSVNFCNMAYDAREAAGRAAGTSAEFWLGGSMPPFRLRRRKF